MQYLCTYPSPVGVLTLAGNDEALTGLWLSEQKYFGATLAPGAVERDTPVFADARRWLDCYFSGREPDFLPPLAPEGTPFRRSVWALLTQIPYGQTTTYGALADQLSRQWGGKRVSPRAVGGAVGHNPISILIPCHRVVGRDGSLTGYAGGVVRKRALLRLERAI